MTIDSAIFVAHVVCGGLLCWSACWGFAWLVIELAPRLRERRQMKWAVNACLRVAADDLDKHSKVVEVFE